MGNDCKNTTSKWLKGMCWCWALFTRKRHGELNWPWPEIQLFMVSLMKYKLRNPVKKEAHGRVSLMDFEKTGKYLSGSRNQVDTTQIICWLKKGLFRLIYMVIGRKTIKKKRYLRMLLLWMSLWKRFLVNLRNALIKAILVKGNCLRNSWNYFVKHLLNNYIQALYWLNFDE